MGIKEKAAYSILWVTLTTIIVRVLNFSTKILLARILAPEDFGLIAIALLFVDSLALFQDLGIGSALIYKRDKIDLASNTAFIAFPVIASSIYAIIYIGAPYAAAYFETPEIAAISRIIALTMIIHSFGTVNATLIEKELDFKKRILPITLDKITYVVVTLFFAYTGYGVWSIVYGQLLGASINVIILWMGSDWRPNFKFDFNIMKELFGYGKHVIITSFLIFAINNVDDAIVGKLLGMEALGFYTIAFAISNFPATNISHLVGKVMFPIYSMIQNDMNKLKLVFTQNLKYVGAFSIPAAIGLFVIAPEFVSLILGQKWLPAVAALQMLCFYGMIRSISATCGPLFKATGNPSIEKNIATLKLFLLLSIAIPLTKEYGILGMAIATTLPDLITTIIKLRYLAIMLKFNLIEISKILLLPTLVSVFMGITLISIKYFIHINSIFYLIVLICIGALLYFTTILVIDRNFFTQITDMLSKL